MASRLITSTRIAASMWADYVTLTGEGTTDEVQAVYSARPGSDYPFVWIKRADVVKDWPR